MPISYKHKIYTTLGTPTVLSGDVVSVADSAGVPVKDYSVKGRTIVWNQSLDKNKYPTTRTVNGVTFTNNGDGTMTANGTAGTDENTYYDLSNTIEIPAGHKMLMVSGAAGGGWQSYALYDANNSAAGYDGSSVGKIYTVEKSPVKMYIFIKSGYTCNNIIFKPQLFDLTQMFGAGNEPSTPAEFRAMFPNDYYPYNAGELKSITGYDKKSMMLKRGLLLDKDTFAGNSTKHNGVDFTYNDGYITVNGTATGVVAEYSLFSRTYEHTITTKNNSKYLFLSHPSLQDSTYYWVFGNTDNAVFAYDETYKPGIIVSPIAYKTGTCYFILRVLGGKTVNNEVTTPQLFDLTAIFGAGNEPSTVAEFLSYFPPDQYDYTTGEKRGAPGNLQLQSSSPQRFQLLDKNKYYSTHTTSGVVYTNNGDGTFTVNSLNITANTYDTIAPRVFAKKGHKYCIPLTNNYIGGYFYVEVDNEKGIYVAEVSNNIYEPPSDDYSFVPRIVAYLNSPQSDKIYKPQLFDLTQMFGAGNEPATVAEFWQRVPKELYEYNPNAYKASNIPSSKYFPDGMKSAGSVYDEINFLSQKAIKRIGVVDLGTLNWAYSTSEIPYFLTSDISDIKKVSSSSEMPGLLNAIYPAFPQSIWYLNRPCMFKIYGNTAVFCISDPNYTDAATFKAAMSGVMLYYELATPVETPITPSLQALQTFKGFNSFSAPNSLTQNGPLSVTYYAEGGANPESGWLTSHKRKLYMGRNIEWNQIFKNSVTSSNGVTISQEPDGTIVLNGTANVEWVNFSSISDAQNQVHKYLFSFKILNNPDKISMSYGWLNRGARTGVITSGESSSIYNQPSEFVSKLKNTGLSGFTAGTVFNNVRVQIMVFDLTQMFGAGNEPATPAEFWSYFDHKLYPYNAGETRPLFKISRKSQWGAPKHYTARWDGVHAAMVRLNDAKDIPTNITNFAHRGSVNASYSNPFDNIYPWSGIKLCNIDINAYRNLSHGDSIKKCVKAWEGDANFSYNDVNGVWRYRPGFWGKSWEEETYRYFDVADSNVYDSTYVHYPEAIVGRWHGRTATLTIGEAAKTCLVPSVGLPATRIAMNALHTYAKNYGATVDSIFSIDADTLLCIVEFATMNTQNAIGSGVSNLYRQSSDLIQENATNSTVVKVLASAGSAYCIPGAIFDIGTSNGGNQVGTYKVVSATTNAGNAQYLDVTLDRETTVTGANYWSVHGLVNTADEGIGSKSGYIGTNGKCNAYYRGLVLFGNMWLYILGAYENKDDHHIWIANSDEEADRYDALNTTVHYDTGLVLPTAVGYTKKLGLLSRSGLLSIPVFCVETGGDSSNPVGDYFYNGVYAYNTVLFRGGSANGGSNGGAFYGSWSVTASYSSWGYAARPRLKNP